MSDVQLDFRKFNLLMGVESFHGFKLAISAIALRRFHIKHFIRCKQLLPVTWMPFLTAAPSFALFVYAFRFFEWCIG